MILSPDRKLKIIHGIIFLFVIVSIKCPKPKELPPKIPLCIGGPLTNENLNKWKF